MSQGNLFDENELSALLASAEVEGGGGLPPADPLIAKVMRDGMTDAEDDPPGIHIVGTERGVRSIADPSESAARRRIQARLGAPPQGRKTAREVLMEQAQREAAQYAPAYPPPGVSAREFLPPAMPAYAPMSMGAQVMIQAVDFNRGVLLTSHGAIPMSPETTSKIMQLSVATMREFFAESVSATMQAYGLGAKRAKPKRRRKKV